jgi:hypothetical protein
MKPDQDSTLFAFRAGIAPGSGNPKKEPSMGRRIMSAFTFAQCHKVVFQHPLFDGHLGATCTKMLHFAKYRKALSCS